MSPVVDAQSGTVKVTLSIPRNQGLVPGMYVEVELVVAREDDALLVPKRALVYDDVQSFVYLLAADDRRRDPGVRGGCGQAADSDDENKRRRGNEEG